MEKLFIFKKAVDKDSVLESNTGTNVDFLAVPVTSLANVAATEGKVVITFRDGNSYSDSALTNSTSTVVSMCNVTLTVLEGKEYETIRALWANMHALNNDMVLFDEVQERYPVSYVRGIESIIRYESPDYVAGGGGSSLPTGGVIDQVLTKQSATDGDADWEYPHTLYVTVRNVSGGTLPKGTPVHANDVTGEVADVIAADASNSSAMPCTYVLNEEINNNQQGIAILTGTITGVDTSSFSPGDVLYVAASGGFTNVKPTGTNLIQNLGIVTKSNASTGSGVVYGTGRSNDVPNLPAGKFFIGSATNTTESAYTLPVSDGSADQVLTTNGSGAVSFQTPAVSKSWSMSMGGRYTMNTPNVHYYYSGIYGWDFYDLSGAIASFSSIPYTNWYAGIVIPDDFTTARVVGTIRTDNTEDYTVKLWSAPNPNGSTSSFSPTEIASQSFTGASSAPIKIDFSASSLSLSATDVLFLTYLRSTGATTTTRVYVSMTIYLT